MSWFTNSISVLFGFQTESTLESIVNQSTTYDKKTGKVCIKFHDDVKREPMMKIIIFWMREKQFQAIVTGLKTMFFIQPLNNRKCFAYFQNHKKYGKCIFMTMTENGKYAVGSSIDIFGQSIYTELAFDLAKQNFLRPQLFNGYPISQLSTGDEILFENQLINPTKKTCALFCRLHKQQEIISVVLSNLTKSRFKLEKNDDFHSKNHLVFKHASSSLNCIVHIGYNAAFFLVLHLKFVESVSADSDSERKENSDVGTEQHFITCMKLVGNDLAQQNLLRSQRYKTQQLADESLEESEQIPKIDIKLDDFIPTSELLTD